MANSEYHVVGLMSGTSLDGLDMAHCTFVHNNGCWSYGVNAAQTVEYPGELHNRVSNCMQGTALDISRLHVDLGIWYGREVRKFTGQIAKPTDFISSHGHTVFHQPGHSLTLQVGSAPHIAAQAGCPVVADFRTTDVALGGLGAPLVPIGDQLLFGEYDVCINLGGIANLSYTAGGKRIAFDVCPFNQVLNALSRETGKDYDEGGKLSAAGDLSLQLLSELNSLRYYQLKGPKSLGKEWVDEVIMPILDSDLPVGDRMNTFAHHTARQVAAAIPGSAKRILLTGGGAFHDYFVSLLRELCPGVAIIVPDHNTIQFKEAIIFAFLGVLRWRQETNCLSSVTGASRDSIGGAVYL
jgi:anhydro-N-acetylmuramic acid kinase